MPRAAVTAAVEFAVGRVGIAAVRALDRDVVGQAHHPRGVAGRVTAWEMALRPSNRRRNRWVVSLLGIRPTDRILEVGFGPGVAIAALVGAGAAHVSGIDHSEVMLRRASRRNAAAIRAGRATLVRAPVEAVPPALAGPFDAVLAVNSVAFWPDPTRRLAELRERLAPGGRLALVAQPRRPGATAETSRAAARDLADLLQRAGFPPPSTRTLPLDPPAVCVLATRPR